MTTGNDEDDGQSAFNATLTARPREKKMVQQPPAQRIWSSQQGGVRDICIR